MSVAILLGVLFGLIDGLISYFMFFDKAHLFLMQDSPTLWDLLFFDVPVYDVFVRALFLVMSILSGAVISYLILQYQKGEWALNEGYEKQRELTAIVNHSPAVATLLRFKDDGLIVDYISDSIWQFGYDPDDFRMGKLLFDDVIAAGDRERVIRLMKHHWQTKAEFSLEYCLVSKDGEIYWIDHRMWIEEGQADRESIGYRGILLDITERKRAEDRLTHVSTHDPLTNLPNRLLFHDHLNQAVLSANENGTKVAVLSLDLDGFKMVNDAFSHDYGDLLLFEIADRLKKCVRKNDTIARMGGDEFGFILPEIKQKDVVYGIVDDIMAIIANPFMVQENEIFITSSVGICFYPEDGKEIPTLLQNADAALHRAKDYGRNSYQFYSSEMKAETIERLALGNQLRRALSRDEFFLLYQPQINLGTGRVVGAEALIRWQNSEQGLVPPDRFIYLAEEMGLTVPIGDWVFWTACWQAKEWQDSGIQSIKIAVNITERQLRHPRLVETVAKVLKDTGLDPSLLELELTENIVFQDMKESMSVLSMLKQLGVRLAVDDFGTGYSTLSHLARFPFDVLKIDQRFAPNVTTDSKDSALVSGIIAIAKNLGIQVIAEGVETADQLLFYEEHGCTQIQGWYFSPAIAAEELAEYIKNGFWKKSVS